MVSFVQMEILLNEIEKMCLIIFMTFMQKNGLSNKKSQCMGICKSKSYLVTQILNDVNAVFILPTKPIEIHEKKLTCFSKGKIYGKITKSWEIY